MTSTSSVAATLLLLSTSVYSQLATSSSSSSSSSSTSSTTPTAPGFEIQFPFASRHAHAIFYPLMPMNVSTLFLTAELRMAASTKYPFFMSYAIKGEANELALAVPGSAYDRSYTLLMGKNGVARNGVTQFPLGGDKVIRCCRE